MKPFVLTREMVKGKVFGAGYPSLPTYTLEEFVQQRYGDLQAAAQRCRHTTVWRGAVETQFNLKGLCLPRRLVSLTDKDL